VAVSRATAIFEWLTLDPHSQSTDWSPSALRSQELQRPTLEPVLLLLVKQVAKLRRFSRRASKEPDLALILLDTAAASDTEAISPRDASAIWSRRRGTK